MSYSNHSLHVRSLYNIQKHPLFPQNSIRYLTEFPIYSIHCQNSSQIAYKLEFIITIYISLLIWILSEQTKIIRRQFSIFMPWNLMNKHFVENFQLVGFSEEKIQSTIEFHNACHKERRRERLERDKFRCKSKKVFFVPNQF